MAAGKQRVLMISKSNQIDSSFVQDLQAEGLLVTHVTTISAARHDLFINGLPFGMIVNLEDLEEDGLDFCNEMTIFANLPVILIGSTNPDKSMISASLSYGDSFVRNAEAYTKEIALRLERLFSRINSFAYALGREALVAHDVVVDFIGKTIQIKGQQISLTPTEIALLHVLVAHSDEIVDNEVLIERVWRGADEGNPNALRVHMHRLRRKLGWERGRDDGLIKTVRGTGYMLLTS